MCGICGKIFLDPGRTIEEGEIIRMRDTMTRRGPDEAGVYVQGNIGLGHRRLSIIDLEASRQPLSNEDGKIWIVFNGEIYNFRELRRDLLSKGHKFKTKGDTEVIVHLYEQYGTRCVERLRGMFAFALWDNRDRSLFLARDRIGIKPLHYFLDENVFLFGSEIKPILADKDYGDKRELDLIALHHYFSFLNVPDPLSMFKGIRKLPPRHTLVLKDGKIKMDQYWDVTFDDAESYPEEDYAEKLIELMREAVEIRLISDVPLGAFLSGGIDSSSVVAIMSELVDMPIKTFSIGFTVSQYNEANDARIVADHFKTDHTEFILNPEDILDIIEELLLYFDEPFADASAIPTYYVSKLAREKVTVVLSGDGGDELFGGYPWRQKRPSYQLLLSRLPLGVRKVAGYFGKFVPTGMRGAKFLSHLEMPYEKYILDAMAVYNEKDRSTLYSADLAHHLREAALYEYNLEYLRGSEQRSWMNRIMEYDLKTYLPNDILTKVDRMSMFNSLEARVPLLDHKLVEFAAGIPANLKIRNGISKYIFKKAMEAKLPREILYKKKQGFSIPLETWLRTGLREYMVETILGTNNSEYFNRENTERMLTNFFDGDDRDNYKIWGMYVFQLWYQKVFKEQTPSSPPSHSILPSQHD